MGFPILAVSERPEHEKVQTSLELFGLLYPDVHGNVAQQLQDSAAADLSPAAWQNAQKSLEFWNVVHFWYTWTKQKPRTQFLQRFPGFLQLFKFANRILSLYFLVLAL